MTSDISTQKARKPKDPELRLAVFFLILIVLTVAFTAISVVQTIIYDNGEQDPPASDTQMNPPDENGPDDSDTSGDENVPSLPVFAGATLSVLPHTVDKTVTYTDALASEVAVLVNATTGEILASKGHDVQFNPASMTKVMTLIVLCQSLTEADLDREIVMTTALREYVTTGSYKDSGCFGFVAGDKICVKDLLYGIGVESAADCTVLAMMALFGEDTAATAEQKLVALMNRQAQSMGLTNTNFDNVIGHESNNNYTTAADMAAIMMYALNSPVIKEILCAKTHAFYIQRLEADGETYARWKMTYFSSLFNNKREGESSRISAYEKKFSKTFTLEDATFMGGKTGTLGVGSASDPWIFSLVSFAKAADGTVYVVVTGKTANAYNVIADAKTLYDNCIQ